MAKNKNPIRIIGICTDGKSLVGGAFKMADTYGFPLTDSILAAENIFDGHISFVDYCKNALLSGWSLERAIKKI